MFVEVSHRCGHTVRQPLYGGPGQLRSQQENLSHALCVDCFYERVLETREQTSKPSSRRARPS